MPARLLALVLALLTLLPSGSASADTPDRWVLVHAGTLLAVPGQAPQTNVTVIVKNDRIVAVRPGFLTANEVEGVPAEQAQLVSLKDKFVLPGLIDCHVHLALPELSAHSKVDTVTLSAADEAIQGVGYARKTLMAGFTTVRDLNAEPAAIFALRKGVRSGSVIGPRILAAGAALSPTGGHSDITNGYREDLRFPADSDAICDGVESCRAAVRRQIQLGADVIKIMATGGVLDDSRAGVDQQFTDDELKSIVDTAHALGRKVAAHAHGAQGIKAAVRAGVDSIEHGTFLDAEGAKMMKDRGTYLVPTLLAGATVAARAEIPGYMPDAIRDKARVTAKILGQNVQLAAKAGIRIAFGTDSGVSEHGRNAEEFALLVKAGMSPADAIRAATVSAADLLGLSAEIGTVEPGKAADLVATDTSPLDDVTALTRVSFVMRGGTVYKGPGTLTP